MAWNTVANWISALGTAAMAGAAFYALRAWRKECIGKRKIELAAEIMMTVMEFQDVLISARQNISNPREIVEIKQWLELVNLEKQNIPNSLPWPIYPDRFICLRPIHCLNQSAAQTDKLSELLNKALIYFGEELYKLLVELYSFLGKIRRASEDLYNNPNNVEALAIAFMADKGTDSLSQRMLAIGEEIKQNLEPIYKDQHIKWKCLKNKQ